MYGFGTSMLCHRHLFLSLFSVVVSAGVLFGLLATYRTLTGGRGGRCGDQDTAEHFVLGKPGWDGAVVGYSWDGHISRLHRWYVQPCMPHSTIQAYDANLYLSCCTAVPSLRVRTYSSSSSSGSSSSSSSRCLSQVTVISVRVRARVHTHKTARVRCGHAHRIRADAPAAVGGDCTVRLLAVLLRDEPPRQGQRGATAAAPATSQRKRLV